MIMSAFLTTNKGAEFPMQPSAVKYRQILCKPGLSPCVMHSSTTATRKQVPGRQPGLNRGWLQNSCEKHSLASPRASRFQDEERNYFISRIGSTNVKGRVYFDITHFVSGIFFPAITFNLPARFSSTNIRHDFDLYGQWRRVYLYSPS